MLIFFLNIKSENASQIVTKGGGAIFINIVIWYCLFKISFVRNAFNKFISKLGVKALFKTKNNPILVLSIFQSEVVAEVLITHLPQELSETTLRDNQIADKYDIHVLTIVKPNGNKIKVKGDTIIEENDTIIVFGTMKSIKSLFVESLET